MDVVLLEVCNRKERCYAWVFVARTGHLQTQSLLVFQGPTDIIITLFVLVVWHILVSVYPTPTKYNFRLWPPSWCILGFCKDSSLVPPHHECWQWTSYTHMSSSGRLCAWHRWTCTEAYLCSEVSTIRRCSRLDLVIRASYLLLWLVCQRIR
jgi:hypothetical protein